MNSFEELLDAAAEMRRTAPETATAEVLIGEDAVTFRFTQLDSLVWANLQAAHPPRIEAVLDIRYGYNYHAVCEAAAPLSGVRIDGDDEVELSREQWNKIFSVVSASGRTAITDAIWGLNEFAPGERLAAMRPASQNLAPDSTFA